VIGKPGPDRVIAACVLDDGAAPKSSAIADPCWVLDQRRCGALDKGRWPLVFPIVASSLIALISIDRVIGVACVRPAG
jgi:hypothetical protein